LQDGAVKASRGRADPAKRPGKARDSDRDPRASLTWSRKKGVPSFSAAFCGGTPVEE